MALTELLEKYNVPGPRYTSYPTVPYWSEAPSENTWFNLINQELESSDDHGISIYIHLPFCESMCTYCGCHKVLTENHSFEKPYIDALLEEWSIYRQNLKGTIRIKEIHLGGGTPTFFSAHHLKKLIESILATYPLTENAELSLEAHPGYTQKDQLEVLSELGFNRISFGIQDFDPKVQKAINRPQSYDQVKELTTYARDLGYSINYDLIYGLPKQDLNSIASTFKLVNGLKPDRIAFYGYAHVPWKSRMQRTFSEEDLPSPEEKINLYFKGRSLLEDAGYIELGMDHFALKSDSLYRAWSEGTLHRNFMGYTTTTSRVLIGLGASSISDSGTAFRQNEKNVWKYQKDLKSGILPTIKGHTLTERDQVIRKHILNIMCQLQTDVSMDPDMENQVLTRGQELLNDGCFEMQKGKLSVTRKGRTFLRNICMTFDDYLTDTPSSKPQFSKAI